MNDKQRPNESDEAQVKDAESVAHMRSSYLLLGNDLTDEQKVDAIMQQVAQTRCSRDTEPAHDVAHESVVPRGQTQPAKVTALRPPSHLGCRKRARTRHT